MAVSCCSFQLHDRFVQELLSNSYHNPALASIYCWTLPSDAQQNILGEAINRSKAYSGHGALILGRLRRFDAEIAESFGQKENAIAQNPFRLLSEPYYVEEVGGLLPIPPTTFKSFIALSYCWHNTTWELTDCLARHEADNTIPISKHMFQAVLEQRSNPNEGIWIDSLCINQQDVDEKKYAVGSMDIAAYIKDLKIAEANLEAPEYSIDVDKKQILLQLYEKLNGARWFKRAWCSQEYVLGKDCIFLIPHSDTVVRLTVTELRLIYTKALSLLFDGDDAHRLEMISLDILAQSPSWNDNIGLDNDNLSDPKKALTATFRRVSELDSSLWADKISLCLNITGITLYYTGRVTDLEECTYVMSVLALAAGDATVLCATGKPLNELYRKSSQSWLRSSQYSDTVSFSLLESQKWKMPEEWRISTMRPDSISLDMIFLTGTIRKPSRESQLRAGLYMSDTLEDNPDVTGERRPLVSNFLGHHHDREARYWSSITSSLACALDCGKDWMSQFLDTVDPEGLLSRNDFETNILLNKADYHLFRSKRDFALDALRFFGGYGVQTIVSSAYILAMKLLCDCPYVPRRDYLIDKWARISGWNHDEEDSPQVDSDPLSWVPEHVRRIIAEPLPSEATPSWLMFATFCVRCLYSVAVDGERAFTMDLGLRNTKAIAIALDEKPTKKRLVLAIPAVLTDSAYSGLRRLWWLEEANNDRLETYRIVRKTHIFGFNDIVADGKVTILKPNVHIVPSGQPGQKLVEYEVAASRFKSWRNFSLMRNLKLLKHPPGTPNGESRESVAKEVLLDLAKMNLPQTYAALQKK